MDNPLQSRPEWFIRRLAETAAWCLRELEGSKPIKHQLRSKALQPDLPTSGLNSNQWSLAVQRLGEIRALALKSENCYPKDIQYPAGGKLLIYFPDENLFDGAAEYSSKGFFDVDNTPPWDTWVCFFDQKLVSWVPDQLLAFADRGIDVNPEQCIQWADRLEELNRQGQSYPR